MRLYRVLKKVYYNSIKEKWTTDLPEDIRDGDGLLIDDILVEQDEQSVISDCIIFDVISKGKEQIGKPAGFLKEELLELSKEGILKSLRRGN